MTHEKGIIVANARSFVEARFGATRWVELLEQMPPEDAATLRGVAATGWYALGTGQRLFRSMISHLADGDEALIEAFASFQAERDLTITYRLFFRLANPALVLEKATAYWHRFYDAGRWATEQPTKGSAVGTLSEFPAMDPLFCRHLAAYFTRMFELVGALDVHSEHPRCRSRGDRACVFTSRWR